MKEKDSPRGEAGQIVLALILIMTVALAIGVSLIQKSLVDVSISSKIEASQRAFSAAEAGIEKALRGDTSGVSLSETGNLSYATVQGGTLYPATAVSPSQQDGIEFASLSKEEFAHIWLANPSSSSNPPGEFYMPTGVNPPGTGRGIEIYWGNPGAEKAAISIRIIHYTGGVYSTNAYYFDSDGTRASSNGFINASATGTNSCTNFTIDTTEGSGRNFYCKVTITPSSSPAFPASGLMLVRIRLLYNSTSQQVALRGLGNCGSACSLPPQVTILVATGFSGDTVRRLKVFQIDKVVPPYFDFAIFSAGEIRKQ